MLFKNLGLIEPLVQAIRELGYTKPTSIQEQSIPTLLSGVDCMACSQTGSGKTAGFTLPLLQRLTLSDSAEKKGVVRALVMVPTRELAAQVAESIESYGKHLSYKTAVIFGGVNVNPQIKTLKHGVEIVVSTPGRLLDHLNQKTIDLSKVEILVLDEADRMLDMGFIHDIRKIMKHLPPVRQTLLFSATFSDEIKKLASLFLKNPKMLESASKQTTADRISQVMHPVDTKRKRELLSHLITTGDWKQVLVFMRTKHGANKLAKQLEQDGITASAIHGNKSQSARTKALADFKVGAMRVLVATDIAARGLDIELLPHVVNYELPNIPEDYVHRIGRTGRAGQEGEAISLVSIDEHADLRAIEKLIKAPIPKKVIPGFEPDPTIAAEPIFRGRPNGAPRSNKPHGNSQPKREERSNGGRRTGAGAPAAKTGQTAEPKKPFQGSFNRPRTNDRGPNKGPAKGPSKGPTR